MERLFRDLPFFVEVARYKSFTRAAEALDIPLSTLSRRILAMEKELGFALFHRSSRKVELTESGQALQERAAYLVSEAGAAFEEILQNLHSPRGWVRISMPPDIYHSYLLGLLSRFARDWPDIRLQISLNTRWVDLLSDPYDLEIRVGPMPDSDLKLRKLRSVSPSLHASPKLLERLPPPSRPEDLATFPCISFIQMGDIWTLGREKETVTLKVNTVHAVNALSVSLEFALAGLGAAWLISHVAERYVRSGELTPILNGWVPPGGVDMSVVMAGSRIPQRVRLVVDYLAAHFGSHPELAP